MTARPGRFHVLSWPLWLKLLAAFAVAIVVPLLLAIAATQPSLQELSLQNMRAYIGENGERQRDAITGALTQARGSLSTFLGNSTYQRRVVSLLLSRSPLFNNLNVEPVSAEAINRLFTDTLLIQSTTMFDSVRLLDRSGQLMAGAGAEGTTPILLETNQSRTAAYRAALNEQVKAQSQNQLITVSRRDNQPVVEIINIIRWRDGSPLGYLIAELNIERVLFANLTYPDVEYPLYSYLLSGDRILLSPEATREQAEAASGSQAARRALSGEVGLDVYAPASGMAQVAGYFAPIPNAPLAIITEAAIEHAALRTRGLFDTRYFTAGLASIALATVLAFMLYQVLAPALERLRAATDGIAAGDFSVPIPDMAREDEVGRLAMSISAMRGQVQSFIHDLEARVAVRTRDIAATYDIGRVIVSQRDLPTLLSRSVNLIVERFPSIYHAQIFLIDDDRLNAHLRASTGAAGEALLARGHRLPVGSVSVIGQVTEQGRIVIARDTASSPVHRRNEFLPDTRAELAIPLRVGEEVIGALDVQSRERGAFDDDLVSVLQTMADQIALAIQNARLYQESVSRLEAIERSNRAATRAIWQDYMRGQRMEVAASLAGTPAADASHLQAEALATGHIAVGTVGTHGLIPIAVPVRLRGEILGAVVWEIPERSLDDNRLQLAQELANRLAISLDNARLFEESQRATERERVVNTIAAKVTAQTDIDEILQTAVREVGQALRAPQVNIRLHHVEDAEPPAQQPSLAAGNGNGNGYTNGHHT